MVTTRRQLVPDHIANKRTYGKGNRKVGITVHETNNTARGANAAAHGNLQARGGMPTASWHWTVDDKEAVQSYGNDWRCWHAGSGSAGDGDDTIAIEICVNEGGDLAKAYQNATELIRYIWDADPKVGRQLFQHNHWSGKNCPTRLRSGAVTTWAAFVAAALHGGAPTPQPPAPVQPAPGPALLEVDGDWGQATTGRLQQVLGRGVDRTVSSQDVYWQGRNPGLGTGWQWVTSKTALGSLLIADLQRRLGLPDDGKIGPNTIKGLQHRFGTPADGVVSRHSRMVIALQERLNKGTF